MSLQFKTNWLFDYNRSTLNITKRFDFNNQNYRLFYIMPSLYEEDIHQVAVEVGCYNITQEGMCFILLPSPRLLETVTSNTLRSEVQMKVGSKSVGIVDEQMKEFCLQDVITTCRDILHFTHGI